MKFESPDSQKLRQRQAVQAHTDAATVGSDRGFCKRLLKYFKTRLTEIFFSNQTRFYGVENTASCTDTYMVIGGLRPAEERDLDHSSDPCNIVQRWVIESITELEQAKVAESGRQRSRAELRALKREHLGACSVRRNWYRSLDAA